MRQRLLEMERKNLIGKLITLIQLLVSVICIVTVAGSGMLPKKYLIKHCFGMAYQKLISGFLSLIRLSDIILLGGLEMRSDLKKIGEQKSTYLVGQTERALYLLDVISTITDRGNNAEVRRKKDGTLTVYEVKKNIVTV